VGRFFHAGLHGRAAVLHHLKSLARLFLDAADGAGNLLGGALVVRSARRRTSPGDNRESAPMLSGPGCLNGRVQGQQIGLLR